MRSQRSDGPRKQKAPKTPKRYIYIYTCVYIYVHDRYISTYSDADICVCLYIYTYIKTNTYVYIYVYIYMYLHMYVYMQIIRMNHADLHGAFARPELLRAFFCPFSTSAEFKGLTAREC